MEQTLGRNPHIARRLVDLFDARFDPTQPDERGGAGRASCAGRAWPIDRPGRQPRRGPHPAPLPRPRPGDAAHQLLPAARRTASPSRTCRSSSTRRRCPSCPLPRPLFEIFVYSPRIEGVHLRGGKVARGGHPLVRPARGLPHRDPRPDEGPDGQERGDRAGGRQGRLRGQAAAGRGRPRGAAGRGASACYQTFMRGLLDITDNLRRRRGRPAAATWSATTTTTPTWSWPPTRARPPSPTSPTRSPREYGFWLGDAFASGGSAGYDHKEMGITARGAWESVKRHFRELGDRHPDAADFTVVGIGDMSGDVFGNGMLLSAHIRLVAAFDHRHIFLDPDPDPAARFAERERLFALPRSSLGRLRHEPDLRRAAASAPRTRQVDPAVARRSGAALDVEAEALTPQRADPRHPARRPVDLLWNGGIGTYVKAARETPRRRRRPGQRRRPRRRRASCAAGWSARAATSASPSAAASSTPCTAAGSTPTPSTTRPASTAPTTRSTSRSCSTRWSTTAT